MAAHLKPVLLTCLLLLMVLMVEVKPAMAKGGKGLKKRVETLEKTVKEQNEKMKKQDEKIKKQEEKIKVLEECKACSKIKEFNETLSELQEKFNSKPDIDECAANSHSCDVNAVCSNTPGFTCTCKAGFSGDGKNCTDIDECASNSDSCGANAVCSNTPGSYTCACKAGHRNSCTDIDECSSNSHGCGVNAVCSNTPGSYTCTCKAGYSGDGQSCTDIDECASSADSCIRGRATCSNTDGSYSCTCNDGYTGDGNTSCLPQECQNYQTLSNGDRKTTFTVGRHIACDDSLGPGWFRFQGAAGTKMATSCVPRHRCGTHAPGWLNGAHPTLADGIVTRQVCFSWNDCCTWAINIQVQSCGDFFIYYINGTPPEHTCHLAYCGAD